jgi:hypothetical protein
MRETVPRQRLWRPAQQAYRRLADIKWKASEKYRSFKRLCHLQRLALAERPLLKRERALHEAEYGPDGDPLVSVTISTWNRAQLLMDRAVASALQQTYQNIEVVVVGDCCTDDTAERLRACGDPRVRFVNLEKRGPYPRGQEELHFVAGVPPGNRALELARGAWIAHLDDDELMVPDHIEVLLRRAQALNAELVYAKTQYEGPPNAWQVNGSAAFAERRIDNFQLLDVPHSTLMFRAYLRAFRFSPLSWTVQLGADWHCLARMYLCGVRSCFVDQVVTLAPLRPGTTQHFALAEDRTNY